MRALKNSVDWAEMYLTDYNRQPWHANKLQYEILLNTDNVQEVYMPRRSGKTEMIVVDAIYNMITQSNVKIGIITYKYIANIWDVLMAKLRCNPELEARLESLYGASKRLRATNGSEIRCWTIDNMGFRGQTLDYLYIDDAECVSADNLQILEQLASKRMLVYTQYE